MSGAPAEGERSAVRGYLWQYDHTAARIYEGLLEGDLDLLRLTDPEAGRVDDLVLVRGGKAHGYQFKSSKFPVGLTFRQLTDAPASGSGLAAALADGWQRLRNSWPDTDIHLVTERYASTSERLIADDATGRPCHFAAFLEQVLEPLRTGQLELADVEAGWEPALDTLRDACGLTEDEFPEFLGSLHIDTGAGPALPPGQSWQRSQDIRSLSDALYRRVGNASGVVELDAAHVLDLMGWTNRLQMRRLHAFPVDLDTYAPLSVAIDELQTMTAGLSQGYIAVIGPPGCGKSTMLSQALTGSKDRIVRYYAYVPGAAPLTTSMTSEAFLHDLALMLNRRGVRFGDHLPPDGSLEQLRRSMAEGLDTAGEEFTRTGRRTLIIIDGLDHVDREFRDDRGLLKDLPRPEAVPPGVLIVVGSRTLDPLGAHAQAQVQERSSVIDLRDHRLTRSDVREICSRAPATAHLPQRLHDDIARRSAGYPLAVGYLINLLNGVDDESAEQVLADARTFEGDVAGDYRAIWETFRDDYEVTELLAVCARLRVGFSTAWMREWAAPRAVHVIRERLRYLFREDIDGWRFFHDSFRQFVVDRTALGDDGKPDDGEEAAVHRRIADLCARSEGQPIASEQLYHCHRAGLRDEVLRLADTLAFRDQFRLLRSAELIRHDIETAMTVAADAADVPALLRLLLCLIEVNERSRALREIDLAGLLFDVGLFEEAVSYGGESGDTRLVDAYRLAEKLAEAGNPAGRRLFDVVDPLGLDDFGGPSYPDPDEVAAAWARAAFRCRPMTSVLGAAQRIVQTGPPNADSSLGGPRVSDYGHWRRYHRTVAALIEIAANSGDASAVEHVFGRACDDFESALAERSAPEAADEERPSHVLAVLADLRFRACSALLDLTDDGTARQRWLDLLVPQQGIPLLYTTVPDVAEVQVREGMSEQASRLLKRVRFEALSVESLQSLAYREESLTIDHHFRLWRLRYLLNSSEGPDAETSSTSDTPSSEDSDSASGPSWEDPDAVELAALFDAAVRTLGRIDAATASGQPVPSGEAWAAIIQILHVIRRPPRISTSIMGVIRNKPDLMSIVVDVAGRRGQPMVQRLSDTLAQLIEDQPEQWPLMLRLELAERIEDLGVGAGWRWGTLQALEADAATEEVESRLGTMARVARGYAHGGDKAKACETALALAPMAFGIGHGKDYQFESWVSWLRDALAEPDGPRFIEDVNWLARLLKAVQPMSEGGYPSGAAELPAALARIDPMAAVRVLEYLVRQGVVSHMDALARLLAALVEAASDPSTVVLVADIAAEVIAPASASAHLGLAETLRGVAERALGGASAAQLVESVATRTDKYALRSARNTWRRGLGLPYPREQRQESGSTVGADHLALLDGQQLHRDDIVPMVQSVADIISLRGEESTSSYFSWGELITQQHLTVGDIMSLAEVFADESSQSLETLACLAEVAESLGDGDLALSLASRVLDGASRDFGRDMRYRSRQKAVGVTIRLRGQEARVAACRDLVRHSTSDEWAAGSLVPEFRGILEALAPDLDAGDVWPSLRVHLEGMAATLDMGDPSDLTDHGCRWWLPQDGDNHYPASTDSSPETAVAELAVRHLAHPTWLVRDAAVAVVARSLQAGNQHTAEALARFAHPDATDDLLEAAGRCLAAARSKAALPIPLALQPLEQTLADSYSQVLRDLADERPERAHRPLRGMYRLTWHRPGHQIEADAPFLAPHEEQYAMLAEHSGLEYDALVAVAIQYASSALEALPKQKTVRDALAAARMKHLFASVRVLASRSAFGMVLSDLKDAGLLDDSPAKLARMVRTMDVDALTRRPSHRPAVVPDPPEPSYELTAERWRSEMERRLDEYEAAQRTAGRILIAARSKLTVLNSSQLYEEFICAAAVGAEPPEDLFARREGSFLSDLRLGGSGQVPEVGEPLVVENIAYTFHQLRADWLAFRPDLARGLGWTADPVTPGRWHTATGAVAVETVWWVDGWWGHGGTNFSDTDAEGHAVILTSEGLADLLSVSQQMTSLLQLERNTIADLDQGLPPETLTRVRTVCDS